MQDLGLSMWASIRGWNSVAPSLRSSLGLDGTSAVPDTASVTVCQEARNKTRFQVFSASYPWSPEAVPLRRNEPWPLFTGGVVVESRWHVQGNLPAEALGSRVGTLRSMGLHML